MLRALAGSMLARDERLDFSLGLVGQFEPVGPEEFDPVVVVRVVAGRDHDAHVGPHRGGQKPDSRGRDWPSSSTFMPVLVSPAVRAFSNM